MRSHSMKKIGNLTISIISFVIGFSLLAFSIKQTFHYGYSIFGYEDTPFPPDQLRAYRFRKCIGSFVATLIAIANGWWHIRIYLSKD